MPPIQDILQPQQPGMPPKMGMGPPPHPGAGAAPLGAPALNPPQNGASFRPPGGGSAGPMMPRPMMMMGPPATTQNGMTMSGAPQMPMANRPVGPPQHGMAPPLPQTSSGPIPSNGGHPHPQHVGGFNGPQQPPMPPAPGARMPNGMMQPAPMPRPMLPPTTPQSQPGGMNPAMLQQHVPPQMMTSQQFGVQPQHELMQPGAQQQPGNQFGRMTPQPGMPPQQQHQQSYMGPPQGTQQMPPMPPGGMQQQQPGAMMPPAQMGWGPARPGMPPGPGMMPPGPPMGGMQMPPLQPMAGVMPPRPGGPPQQQHQHGMMPPQQQPGQQQQPYPSAYPEQPRRTLDPDQMPSPIVVMEEDQTNNGGFFDARDRGQTPPLVTTRFVVRDCGQASPRFIRSTLYHVPSTPDQLKQTGVPFGLVLSPFAQVADQETEPPMSDFGPTGPVRCVRCKAYMCPFMQFIDGGRRFHCIFCKATTDVSQEYFQHLDHNGYRLDHFQRPELCLGTYEILATKDYCRDSKEPHVPGIIFAIDVSYPMVKEGIVQLLCQNIKRLLKECLPHDPNCDKARPRVGFMTYDSKVHFYNINRGLSQPQQMSVGDVDDMFVPLVEGFLVDPEEAEAVIDALVEQIPEMFGSTRETETVLGPVIQAGKEAFKAAECAGKLIIFHHNLPVAEAPGKLKNRDDRKVLGGEKEKTVLVPQTKFYNDLGQECVAAGCTVDLFLFNNAYIDVATLSQVSRLTGGQVYKYTYFQVASDGERFLRDLERNLSRTTVFDAIMRVRTSTGVRPVDFYGSFYMGNTTDTELASMNSDSAIACEIKHDDKLTEEEGVYIQVAILFTSSSGQRRLRVLNLALNTGNQLADMYRNCELDTIINFTAKQSISRLMDSTPKVIRETLIASCANILACYRKHCASPSSAGQLILPECMKLLPLYINCLVKSDAISGGPDVGCDDRAFLMNAVSSMDVSSTVAYFYPRLYPIHDVSTQESGIPAQLRCSSEKIRDDGVYLLENGFYLFMYIGLAADSNWTRDVFGVASASQVNLDQTALDERDNPVSQRVRDIIDILRDRHSRFMRLVLVRQREKLDVLFRHYLVEDKASNDSFSYVDFLCHMHKEIRALLG